MFSHLESSSPQHLPFVLPFVKMHGTGNDFVVFDALRHPLPDAFDFAAAAQHLCARGRGIGADGLLTLEPPEAGAASAGAAVRMRMWNPDGSADMCGNGLRCVAWLARARRHVNGSSFAVQTLAGARRAEIVPHGLVRVAMGHPRFAPRAIPMLPPPQWPCGLSERAVEYTLPLADVEIPHVTTLSTGSTHTVIFRDAPLDEDSFARLSPRIEHHPWFPQRTSVMWARLAAADIVELRIWERGVGETLACGTGACATSVAAQITARCGKSVTVQSRGGSLQIRWQPGEEIEMTGPAQIVFEGRCRLPDSRLPDR